MSRLFDWYMSNPLASRENALSPRIIREEYDSLFWDNSGLRDTPSFLFYPNTPVVYALINANDERKIYDLRHASLKSGTSPVDYLESNEFPQILAVAEDRKFILFDEMAKVAKTLSLARSLERRGAVAEGAMDTQTAISRIVTTTLCDCAEGEPRVVPIVLSYTAPATVFERCGHLTDITEFHRILNRASSL